MEKIVKKISVENHEKYILEMAQFGWEKVNVNQVDSYCYVEFERDPNMPHYQEIKELENKWYSHKEFPMWPTIGLTIIAFALITILLVMWIVQKDAFNKLTMFCALALPAFGCIILATVCFGIRVMKMKKTLDTIEVERKEIKEALEKLNNNDNDSK